MLRNLNQEKSHKKTRGGLVPSNMRERGFTLIELLVVIAVIGLLASIVLVALGPARAKSRDAARIADLQALSQALQLYYNDNQSYPTPPNAYGASGTCIESPWWDCWGNTTSWTCAQYPNALGCVLSKYLPTIPRDPAFYDAGNICSTVEASNTLSYYSDGKHYFLCAYLENSQPPGYVTPSVRTTGCASYCNYFLGDWSPMPPL